MSDNVTIKLHMGKGTGADIFGSYLSYAIRNTYPGRVANVHPHRPFGEYVYITPAQIDKAIGEQTQL